MENMIYPVVRTIAVYLLFLSVFMELVKNSPIKTYVYMFAGMMFVLLVAGALLRMFSLDFSMEDILIQAKDADQFYSQLEKAQEAGEEELKRRVEQAEQGGANAP